MLGLWSWSGLGLWRYQLSVEEGEAELRYRGHRLVHGHVLFGGMGWG